MRWRYPPKRPTIPTADLRAVVLGVDPVRVIAFWRQAARLRHEDLLRKVGEANLKAIEAYKVRRWREGRPVTAVDPLAPPRMWP